MLAYLTIDSTNRVALVWVMDEPGRTDSDFMDTSEDAGYNQWRYLILNVTTTGLEDQGVDVLLMDDPGEHLSTARAAEIELRLGQWDPSTARGTFSWCTQTRRLASPTSTHPSPHAWRHRACVPRVRPFPTVSYRAQLGA